MKFLKVLFSISVAIISIVGCQDNEIGTLYTEVYGDIQRLSVTVEDANRTRVDVDGTEVTWADDDVIYVAEISGNSFSNVIEFNIDANSISSDGKNAEFTSSRGGLESGESYIAFHGEGDIADAATALSNDQIGCYYFYNSDDIRMQSNTFVASSVVMPQVLFSHKSALLELSLSWSSGVTYSDTPQSLTISSSESVFVDLQMIDVDGTERCSVSTDYTIPLDNVTISSNNSVTVRYPIVWNDDITSVNGDFVFTLVTSDGKISKTTKPMKVLLDGVRYRSDLVFDAPIVESTELTERDILELFYEATGGDNWTNRDNWCSDADISDWYGVSVSTSTGRVMAIELSNNNLSGSIPDEICDLSSLEYLNLSLNNLTGSMPDNIEDIDKLYYLNVSSNSLSGSIDFAQVLSSLKCLYLSYNSFSGSISTNVANLFTDLSGVNVTNNMLSGAIPSSLSSHSSWNQIAWNILDQKSGYGFDADSYDVYLESSTITTVDGKTINTDDFFGKNELTCVLLWRTWCGYSTCFYINYLSEIYKKYSSLGFDIIAMSDETTLATITNYVAANSLPGEICQLSADTNDYSNGSNRVKYLSTSVSPTYAVVDSKGKVLFSESIYPLTDSRYEIEDFVDGYFADHNISGSDESESTDYSSDGKYYMINQATVGNGINIVIMGDGFIDKDMGSGGKYETRMKATMEAFFSEEPYATYRDRFNVYYVNVISANEGIGDGLDTALDVWFGSGTAIGGDNELCLEYAKNIPAIANNSNDLTIIISVNSSDYAGTCYMEGVFNSTVSYTTSYAYCSYVENDSERYRQIVTHEAGGHGFGLLLDEYFYSGTTISASSKETYQYQYDMMGWGVNVDVVDDASTIHWSHMLDVDSPYSDLVGVYEGSYTYEYGAYRSTNSDNIMLYNVGGYNSISRQAIYKRIMKISGYDYSYDSFIVDDASNRAKEAIVSSSSQTRASIHEDFVPLAQPVMTITHE